MARKPSYNRDKAIDAAMHLFWQKGYHAASLKDIEQALQMKPGSIYAAFGSKEDLFIAALESYHAKAKTNLKALVEYMESPLSCLIANLGSLVEIDPDDPQFTACMLVKTVVDTKATDPKLAAKADEFIMSMRREFKELFVQAQNSDEIDVRLNPERLAVRYQANISALRLEMHRHGDCESVHQLADDMMQELETLRRVVA